VYICMMVTKGTQQLQQRYVRRGRKACWWEGRQGWKAGLEDFAIRGEDLRSRAAKGGACACIGTSNCWTE